MLLRCFPLSSCGYDFRGNERDCFVTAKIRKRCCVLVQHFTVELHVVLFQ